MALTQAECGRLNSAIHPPDAGFFNVTDLRLGCIEGDGLCRDSPPKQSEGLHAALPFSDLCNSDVGVWAKDLIAERYEVTCKQRIKHFSCFNQV